MTRGAYCASQQRRRSGENEAIVLAILRSSNRPKGAYDIADIAAKDGIKLVPNQVYRTLDRLIRKDVVLRLESLNAYMPKRSSADLCLICSQCHAVELVEAPSINDTVCGLTSISRFQLSPAPLEAQGRCAARRAAGMFEESRVVRQSEAGECGLACVAMVARHHGYESRMSDLRRRFSISSRGSSLKDLMSIADQLQFNSRALKSDIPSLSQLALPAILHWDLNHYVVLSHVRRRLGVSYTILDPASGAIKIDEADLAEHFTGIALELSPSSTFSPIRQRARLKLNQLWSRVTGLRASLINIMALSIIIQLVALVAPFYMQLAIDTALPASDIDPLKIIAAGFAGLASLMRYTVMG